MNKGDRIIMGHITGEVTACDEWRYTVRWDAGGKGREMSYLHEVTWEDADDFIRIEVGTYLDDLYEKNKGELPWNDAS